MRAKIILLASGLSVGIATAIVSLGTDSTPAANTAPPRDHLEWGVYQILWSRSYSTQLENELSKFASKPDYVMFYRDLQRPFPKFAVDTIAEQGATAIVSLELWSWHGGRQGSFLTLINDGRLDEFLRSWAADAKLYGKRVLLRFGFEFNGDWFSWSLDPKAYVRAWRHAHAIFQEQGASNVQWVWAPNVASCPDTPENDMHLYYPGDDVVDWVGVDGYNFGENHDEWHAWQSFHEIFDEVLNDFGRRYPGKPVVIAEFGCAPGPAEKRANWIREAYHDLQNRSQVKAVVWFNYDKRREREPNFRVDATAGALDAFNRTFAAPR